MSAATRERRPALDALCLLLAGAFSGYAAADTVIDLQPFKQVTTSPIAAAPGSATLTNLNPRINSWYVLTLEWDGAPAEYFHLENSAPLHQRVVLDPYGQSGLVVRTDLDEFACELWPTRAAQPLAQARASGASYAPLCDGRLYLRNPAVGYRTTRELISEFLRDRVWGGEKLIEIVKETVERDAQIERSTARPAERQEAAADSGPVPASLDPTAEGLRPLPAGLGIELDLPTPGSLAFGRWYETKAAPGVYVSIVEPGLVAAQIRASHRDRVRPLDPVESEALVYLVAFDLRDLRLGFEIGTDHPRVGWSERSSPQVREDSKAGPDGFDTIAPLVATGIVNPIHVSRTVATFTGGFKRSHGAFRTGELALTNGGSHYGWIEYGTVLSTLQPRLATLVMRDDGRIELKTWQASDARSLVSIEHARQNGVPIIENGPPASDPVPGALVGNWSMGNWSGSATGEQRTVRGGLCAQTSDSGRYLVYGYFSSVTPSAMARVFQAYGCSYAMLLDMNALEHTYLALYDINDAGIRVQHLVRGMEAVDRSAGGRTLPRFIGYPDNRDFFYVLRRQEDEP